MTVSHANGVAEVNTDEIVDDDDFEDNVYELILEMQNMAALTMEREYSEAANCVKSIDDKWQALQNYILQKGQN